MIDVDEDSEDDWLAALMDLQQFVEQIVHDEPELVTFLQDTVCSLGRGEFCSVEVSTEVAKAHSCSHGAYDHIKNAEYVAATLRRDAPMSFTLKYTLAGTTIRFNGSETIQDELFNNFAMGYFREPKGAPRIALQLPCQYTPTHQHHHHPSLQATLTRCQRRQLPVQQLQQVVQASAAPIPPPAPQALCLHLALPCPSHVCLHR